MYSPATFQCYNCKSTVNVGAQVCPFCWTSLTGGCQDDGNGLPPLFIMIACIAMASGGLLIGWGFVALAGLIAWNKWGIVPAVLLVGAFYGIFRMVH